MKSNQRRRYTAEFKAQAVELASTGRPVSEVARDLCISDGLLHRWKSETRLARSGGEGQRAAGEVSEGDELRELRRVNTLLRQENDILKKAAVILGTRPPGNFGK